MTDAIDAAAALRTRIRLADGRQLVYFDDQPGRRHAATDPRRLRPVRVTPQVRHDPVHGEWVVIASHRQERTHLPAAEQCPLCASSDGNATEIPDGHYDVVVFDNRFPSLVPGAATAPTSGVLLQGPASGSCEVICFSSDHAASFSGLAPQRLRTIGRALVDRTTELSQRDGVAYVFCFENRGEEIGVTLHHPHGQIYAYPFVPPRVARALDCAEDHLRDTGRCVFCDLLEAELADGRRIVAQTERFVAFAPWASRWPLEVHLYARRHVADLADLAHDELEEALVLQADVLGRFDRVYRRAVPYVAGWIQAPVSARRELSHLRLEAFSPSRSADKLKYVAGSESGVGVFINDVLPERAAEMLRGVRP